MAAEVSSTRLYLGNLPRDGMQVHLPSSHVHSTRFLVKVNHNTGGFLLSLKPGCTG